MVSHAGLPVHGTDVVLADLLTHLRTRFVVLAWAVALDQDAGALDPAVRTIVGARHIELWLDQPSPPVEHYGCAGLKWRLAASIGKSADGAQVRMTGPSGEHLRPVTEVGECDGADAECLVGGHQARDWAEQGRLAVEGDHVVTTTGFRRTTSGGGLARGFRREP